MSTLTIRRLGYALGASVTGADLTRPLDEKTLAEIKQAWYEHIVLCFPNQDMNPQTMTAFCSNFGELDDHRRAPENRHPEYPTLKIVSNKPIHEMTGYKGERSGRTWHSDQSFTNHPSTGTFLNAKAIPEVGGETMFANMYMAYETLSPALRTILDGLDAVHDQSLDAHWSMKTPEQQEASRKRNPPVVHPAVRVHPDSGRKALFINRRVRQFVGMTEEESTPLLDFLNDHCEAYERLYRHKWTVGDLLMWDNRAATHVAIQDYDQSDTRRMLRCTVLGPKAGYVFGADDGNAKTLVGAGT